MTINLTHFAIHADDVERARAFYEGVFGWSFQSWGPPGFYMVFPGGDDSKTPHGSLQSRSEPLTGTGLRGFECSFAVDDLAAIAASVEQHGGTVEFKEMEIPTVGTLTKFRDTEGNVVTAIRYA